MAVMLTRNILPPYMGIFPPAARSAHRRVGRHDDRSDRRVRSHKRYRLLPAAVSRSGRRTGRNSKQKKGPRTQTPSDLLFLVRLSRWPDLAF